MIHFECFDFKKIIAVELWLLRNKLNENSKTKNLTYSFLIYFFFKLIYRSCFLSPVLKINNNKKFDIFYIRSHSRPDLNKHSEWYENVNNTSVCVLSIRKKKLDIFNLLKIILFFFYNYKFWYLGLKKNNLKLLSSEGLYILLKFFEALSDFFKVIPYLKKHKKLVCFQGTLPTENFLCQYANALNIQTYSLQHSIGIYSEKGTAISRFPICNYINLVSKNILCWGKHNKFIFKKHTSAKIYIIGKPHLPNYSSSDVGLTFIFENKEFKKINDHLLKLSDLFELSKFKVSRWFKPSHPLLSSGIIRDGPLRDIIIGCNSSLVAELGFLGHKVFVTKHSNFKKYLPKELIIDDKSFFKNKNNFLKKYPKRIWKNFIYCSKNESLRRYKKILQ